MNADDLQSVEDLIRLDRQALAMEAFARQALVARLKEAKLRELVIVTLPADMAMLAAQQVNEVRLKILETPKEIGWGDVALELVLTFVINSAFMEKLAAATFSRLIARAVTSRQALGVSGKRALDRLFETEKRAAAQFQRSSAQLAALEQRASQLKTVVKASGAVFKGPPPMPRAAFLEFSRDVKGLRRVEAEARVLAEALNKPPQINAETPKTYAEMVAAFESGTASKKNATAFFKATKDAVKKGGSVSPGHAMSASDGSSVAVIEHFQSVARAQRLEIESRYAEFERVVMSYPLDGGAFEGLFAAFDPAGILDAKSEQVFLDGMASDLRLRLEAMIWVRYLGFSAPRKYPTVHDSSGATTIFDGIQDKLTLYLLARFGGLVVEFKTRKGGQIDWVAQADRVRARELREYFWAIAAQFE